MVNMSRWQQLAMENIHRRTAAPGRMSGKIVIVTGAAQGPVSYTHLTLPTKA